MKYHECESCVSWIWVWYEIIIIIFDTICIYLEKSDVDINNCNTKMGH